MKLDHDPPMAHATGLSTCLCLFLLSASYSRRYPDHRSDRLMGSLGYLIEVKAEPDGRLRDQ